MKKITVKNKWTEKVNNNKNNKNILGNLQREHGKGRDLIKLKKTTKITITTTKKRKRILKKRENYVTLNKPGKTEISQAELLWSRLKEGTKKRHGPCPQQQNYI